MGAINETEGQICLLPAYQVQADAPNACDSKDDTVKVCQATDEYTEEPAPKPEPAKPVSGTFVFKDVGVSAFGTINAGESRDVVEVKEEKAETGPAEILVMGLLLVVAGLFGS